MRSPESSPSGLHGVSAELFSKKYANGEKTDYELVTLEKPSRCRPIYGNTGISVLASLARLFNLYILPKSPVPTATVLFYLPEGIDLPFPERYEGELLMDRSARTRFWLNRMAAEESLRIEGQRVVADSRVISRFLRALEDKRMFYVHGMQSATRINFLSITRGAGFLSDHYARGKIVFNTHFFLMDLTDLETHYDMIGEPHGLLMIDGQIIEPALYRRAALFLDRQGSAEIRATSIREMSIQIDGNVYSHGHNCELYTRPEMDRSPLQRGSDLAIVGRRICGFKRGGGIPIPEAGYVLHLNADHTPVDPWVGYTLDADYDFGIQVGPALISGGLVYKDFQYPYYDGTGIKYPPTVFPPGWNDGLAARIGIGTRGGRLALIWAEGSKIRTATNDSRGFTLGEFAAVGAEHGFENLLNLDGGGSAQMSIDSQKHLKISDRVPGREYERPVPLGLSVDISKAAGHTVRSLVR